jgi:hypothetical protein
MIIVRLKLATNVSRIHNEKELCHSHVTEVAVYMYIVCTFGMENKMS